MEMLRFYGLGLRVSDLEAQLSIHGLLLMVRQWGIGFLKVLISAVGYVLCGLGPKSLIQSPTGQYSTSGGGGGRR